MTADAATGTRGGYWAIVPVKPLATAKGRLAACLTSGGRQRLVRRMLEDVLAVLAGVPELAATLVVTADADVARLATARGASVLLEPEAQGINVALAAGIARAVEAGADGVLLLPGDVPLATSAEIRDMIAAAASGASVVIVADEAGSGTNALLLRPAGVLAPAFGPGSFARHTAAASASGIPMRALTGSGLAADIDEAADLRHLSAQAGYAFLKEARKRPSRRADPLAVALAASENGDELGEPLALALAGLEAPDRVAAIAERRALARYGTTITYSRKVFIPLTQLCRDVCHYCTFAHAPRKGTRAFMSLDEVLAIATAGAHAGCKEALFTLGDKPELRYGAARRALAEMGYASTLDYLESAARQVREQTGLLPHLNPGVVDVAWLRRLKAVSASQGMMLESTAAGLAERGGAHFGSPDKAPAVRLAALAAAGEAEVPFTTGLLIGIGESREDRIRDLLAIRELHARYGHIQEVIIQNFRAKPGTRMANAVEPTLAEHVWTIAVARLLLGPDVTIQAPPNLRDEAELAALVRAGINDWGGVSPVTPDHVNPEAPWPHIARLAEMSARAGRELAERLSVHPSHQQQGARWLSPSIRTAVMRLADADGLARSDELARADGWTAGGAAPPPAMWGARHEWRDERRTGTSDIARILARARERARLGEAEIVRLFAARGSDLGAVLSAADTLRQEICGAPVTYVVNRNINYTNICTYGCRFCAFSKGRPSNQHRDRPYDLPLDEIGRRTREAWERGAVEVCLQGGIAARYTGETYLSIVAAVKAAAPAIHVHAFSPLEVWHGATTLGLPLRDYLARLRDAGLSSLPGTAAEILDDEVRRELCPDKITTEQWLEVMRTAHEVGLGSTATIMFGHIDAPRHWARHLLRVRELQEETGGFTELVPLPFVASESPIYLKGGARQGPTFREAILMHAVARLVLAGRIDNIQASWVKLGPAGVRHALDAGCNDVGGVLMNESITRAAGAVHGQEMTAIELERMIRAAGRPPRQRTTRYETPSNERIAASFAECEVRPMSMMAAE
ncbi:MAG: 5-amino-6-(D-ribitylamino)uracil--L-tyrosine 4-hydroxyphenyl transferase CofH [Hyphomicrobiaceae bacterium]